MATAADIIAYERAQLGVHEDPPNSNRTRFGAWYGLDGNAWCFMFQSYCWAHAGIPLPNMGSKNGGHYTPDGVAWAKAHGMWDEDGHYNPGDLIFFTWGSRFDSAGHPLAQHVGMVVDDDGRTIHTLEGNVGPYGGSVQALTRYHGNTVLGVLKSSRWLTVAPPKPVPVPVPAPPPARYTGPVISNAERFYHMV